MLLCFVFQEWRLLLTHVRHATPHFQCFSPGRKRAELSTQVLCCTISHKRKIFAEIRMYVSYILRRVSSARARHSILPERDLDKVKYVDRIEAIQDVPPPTLLRPA